ncbi:MAG: LCP family protein [Eubacteriales bacterium]|nr:LCP family protein [Eubacteriales bacterium]
MKKNIRIIISLIAMLLIIGGLTVAALRRSADEVTETAGQATHAETEQTELTYDGASCSLDKNIETYLLVGLDSKGEKVSEETWKFYNHIQSDVLLLAAVDRREKTVNVIQLNRDTMMEVPWLDVTGRCRGTTFKQLALSYNSGSGGLDSLHNTKNAVSSLLFDAPIDHCLAFTMAGIAELNDLVGGVTVMIDDDLTAVDPQFKRGSVVTLHGDQAQKFLRARLILDNDTNAARMARHRDYLEGFLKSAETVTDDPDFVLKAAEKLDKYTVTDMTAQDMSELVQYVSEYGISSVSYPEGELRLTEHYEFYVDKASLWEIVKDTYCR